MRVVSCKMDEDLIIWARKAAHEKGVSFSELVRVALRKYLQNEYEKCKPFITKRIRIYC